MKNKIVSFRVTGETFERMVAAARASDELVRPFWPEGREFAPLSVSDWCLGEALRGLKELDERKRGA